MDRTKLEQLGLTKNEATVYLALLEIGETKTGAIVKQTQIHRVTIYDALNALIDKGLATSITKENRKYFSATEPKFLVSFLKEKQRTAEQLLPKLEALSQASKKQQSVALFEGIRGLKAAMNNMLDELGEKDDHCVFASGNMEPTLGPYYELYQRIKREKAINTRVIYDKSFKKKKKIIEKTFGRITFFELGPFPTDTWIYKDKVLIVTYTANPPIAIRIESQETANSYRKIFDGYWKKAEKWKGKTLK
jgi:sugar-specific transcriptional regulator TrmB